jgi:hypothetical protein
MRLIFGLGLKPENYLDLARHVRARASCAHFLLLPLPGLVFIIVY